PAQVAARLDLPGDPRGRLPPDLLAPQGRHRLDQPVRRVGLHDLALGPDSPPVGPGLLVARARRPLGRDLAAEGVPAPGVAVGDRVPQALGGGADVDLEDLLHGVLLDCLLEPAQAGGPGLGVLAHPPVVYEPDRDRVQEVELLAAVPLGLFGHLSMALASRLSVATSAR